MYIIIRLIQYIMKVGSKYNRGRSLPLYILYIVNTFSYLSWHRWWYIFLHLQIANRIQEDGHLENKCVTNVPFVDSSYQIFGQLDNEAESNIRKVLRLNVITLCKQRFLMKVFQNIRENWAVTINKNTLYQPTTHRNNIAIILYFIK